MAPELVEATGTVILPLDRLQLSFVEMTVLSSAQSFALSDCLADKGVTFVPPAPLDDPIYLSEQYFGPWTSEQAERFGFVLPMSDADLVANGVEGAPLADDDADDRDRDFVPLSEDDQPLADQCAAEADTDQFVPVLIETGPWTASVDSIPGQVLDDDRAKAAIDDLTACFDTQGLKPSSREEPWWPAGARGDTISADQIELALKVVDCKNHVDFTDRMAKVEASYQAVVIDEFADELFAQRQRIDAALVVATGILAEHGYMVETV